MEFFGDESLSGKGIGKIPDGKVNQYDLNGTVPANNQNGQLLLNSLGAATLGNIINQRTPFNMTIVEYGFLVWIYSLSTATLLEIDTYFALIQTAKVRIIRAETIETLSFSVSNTMKFQGVYGTVAQGLSPIQSELRLSRVYNNKQKFSSSESIKVYLDNFASAGLPTCGFQLVLKGVTL